MGFDLRGAGGVLHLNWSGWFYCLRVARAFGWEPAGTEEPKLTMYDPDGRLVAVTSNGQKWDGGYFTNDYQAVTDADAKALAAALDRAITAVETGAELSAEQHEAFTDESDRSAIPTAAYAQAFSIVEMRRLHPLRVLAEYARQGDFLIW
jgi:hypothetical protein